MHSANPNCFRICFVFKFLAIEFVQGKLEVGVDICSSGKETDLS